MCMAGPSGLVLGKAIQVGGSGCNANPLVNPRAVHNTFSWILVVKKLIILAFTELNYFHFNLKLSGNILVLHMWQNMHSPLL